MCRRPRRNIRTCRRSSETGPKVDGVRCCDGELTDGVIGSCGGYRGPSRDRGGLEDRVGQSDRRPGAYRDVGVAEELAQDALVAALEQWPEAGVPQNPGAWLMAAAKHRAI